MWNLTVTKVMLTKEASVLFGQNKSMLNEQADFVTKDASGYYSTKISYLSKRPMIPSLENFAFLMLLISGSIEKL